MKKEQLKIVIFIIAFLAVASIITAIYLSTNNKTNISLKDKKILKYLKFSFQISAQHNSLEDENSIEMSVVARNISKKQVEIFYPNSLEVDFLAYQVDEPAPLFLKPSKSKLIWRSSDEQKNITKPHSIIIKPNEEKNFTAKWNKKNKNGTNIKPGNYRIKYEMLHDDFKISMSTDKK